MKNWSNMHEKGLKQRLIEGCKNEDLATFDEWEPASR